MSTRFVDETDAPPPPTEPEIGRRVALLIGNARYRNTFTPLKNPGRDALLMSALFTELGYDVECRFDLGYQNMLDAIRAFGERARGAETAVFFYAGHGCAPMGDNLMIPVDFEIARDSLDDKNRQITMQSVSIMSVLSAAQNASRRLLFLDACRDAPDRSAFVDAVADDWRLSLNSGYRKLGRLRNVLISFAAEWGARAYDGVGRNSPYSLSLFQHAQRNDTIPNTLTMVAGEVYNETGVQKPDYDSGLLELFALGDESVALDYPSGGNHDDDVFNLATRTDKKEAYAYYLELFPPGSGRHSVDAMRRLEELGGSARPDRRVRIHAPYAVGAKEGWFDVGLGRKQWFRDFDGAPEMVVTPGWAAEPTRASAESPFAIGRFPVTAAEWRAAIADGVFKHEKDAWLTLSDRAPIIDVAWREARRYADWLRDKTGRPYRLPTEAEWEFCCRAGATTAYAFGDRVAPDQACYTHDEARPRTAPVEVGRYAANNLGLYDMHGNVWEWCEDRPGRDPSAPPTSPKPWELGDERRRIVRGGCFNSRAAAITAVSRQKYHVARGKPFVGFRVACPLQ